MSKVILFNGPKLCGKDVAISHLKSKGLPLVVRECKDKLHNLTQEFFCIQPEKYWEIYNSRGLKEKPLPEFRVNTYPFDNYHLSEIVGYNIIPDTDSPNWSLRYDQTPKDSGGHVVNLSIREAMIYVSEVICKPRFGEEYFGEARTKSIRDGELVVDGSCGFVDELKPLIKRVGQENVLLLRIHRDGYTFEGDSRSYIPNGIIDNTMDVFNNGSEESYFNEVEKHVEEFIGK